MVEDGGKMKVTKRQLKRIIKEEKQKLLLEFPEGYQLLDVMTMEDMLEDLQSGKEIYLDDAELGDFVKWAVYDEKILGKSQLRSDWVHRERKYRVQL